MNKKKHPRLEVRNPNIQHDYSMYHSKLSEHHHRVSSNYENKKPPLPQTAGLQAASKLLSKHFQSNSTSSRRENISNVMNTTANSSTVASMLKVAIDHRQILDEMSSQR